MSLNPLKVEVALVVTRLGGYERSRSGDSCTLGLWRAYSIEGSTLAIFSAELRDLDVPSLYHRSVVDVGAWGLELS